MGSFHVSISVLAALGVVATLVYAGDPDPVQDFAIDVGDGIDDQKVPASGNGDYVSEGFTFRNVFQNGDVSRGSGGVRAALNTQIFPALKSQGITCVQFQLKPCGVNQPHTHPRAAELLSLLKGGPLQVGFVDTSGKAHIDILHEGDVTMFPRGLLHYELNMGTETAFFLSALNSESPGVLPAASSLFSMPKRVLETSINGLLDISQQKSSSIEPSAERESLLLAPSCTPGKDITIDV
eukprot:c1709_g1_i1 orf=224-937(+)